MREVPKIGDFSREKVRKTQRELTCQLLLPFGIGGLELIQTHGGVVQVLILIALVCQTEGSVLTFKYVQVAHLVAPGAEDRKSTRLNSSHWS